MASGTAVCPGRYSRPNHRGLDVTYVNEKATVRQEGRVLGPTMSGSLPCNDGAAQTPWGAVQMAARAVGEIELVAGQRYADFFDVCWRIFRSQHPAW
jgi:hypothetical protein